MADLGIALHRFGLGARPDEAAPAEPRGWLLDQLGRYQPAVAAAPSSEEVAARLRDYYATRHSLRREYGPRRQARPPRPTDSAAAMMAADPPIPPPMYELGPAADQTATATATPDPFRAAIPRRTCAPPMPAPSPPAPTRRSPPRLPLVWGRGRATRVAT